MYTVAILMATYNGKRFLPEQIDSICSQQGVQIKLWVRDDGSTDGTQLLLEEYKQQGLLDWYQGSSLGPAKAFLDLLQTSPKADFYAFADQDDYWMTDKMKSAVECLHSEHMAGKRCMYFGQTQLVDTQLQPLPTPQLHLKHTFEESLIYQFVGGNTIVMNEALRTLLMSYQPQYICMHDVWVYDVAKATDAFVYFDEVPHILYRQHGNNVVGNGLSMKTDWARRVKRILQKKEHRRYRTACELERGFSAEMSERNLSILSTFTNYRKGVKEWWKLLTDPTFTCGDGTTNLYFRLAVLLGTL
ncbi:MAG: glycosyltransferase [Bacteroidaceae bacterium]|nr:glycosyltransferase [Bacteroidaceae bacterium]